MNLLICGLLRSIGPSSYFQIRMNAAAAIFTLPDCAGYSRLISAVHAHMLCSALTPSCYEDLVHVDPVLVLVTMTVNAISWKPQVMLLDGYAMPNAH
jgi:hypothetical protein